MWYLILLIVIAILYAKNKDLRKDIEELKSEKDDSKRINFCPKCGYDLINMRDTSSSVPSSVSEDIIVDENVLNKDYSSVKARPAKKKYDETEIKNSTILSVGAILVIVAAIIFLTSTWNTSLDIVKTLIIFFMFLVFLGSSFIADKYLNIPQTSKVFLYIALSYLPIIFFSIPLFSLLGEYLSLTGDGKYIYLFMSCAILSTIYYLVMKNKNDIFSGVGIIIFQVLSVITFVMIFTTETNYILFGYGLYGILNHYLINNNVKLYDELINKNLNNYLTIGLVGGFLFLLSFFHGEMVSSYSYIALLITIYFNLYYFMIKENDYSYIFDYVGPGLILYTSMCVPRIIDNDIVTYYMFGFIGVIVTYLVDFVFDHKCKYQSYILSNILLVGLYLASFIFDSFVPSYLIIFIISLFNIGNYFVLKDNNADILMNIVMPVSVGLFILNLVVELEVSVIVLPFVYLFLFLGCNLSINKKSLKNTCEICSTIFSIIGYLFVMIDYSEQYMLFGFIGLMGFVMYLVVALLGQNKLHKYISYMWLLVGIFFIFMNYDITDNLFSYVFSISLMITFGLEFLFKEKGESDYLFLLSEFILCFFAFIAYGNLVSLLLLAVITVLYVYVNVQYKKEHLVYFVPVVTFNLMLSKELIYNELDNGLVSLSFLLSGLLLFMCFKTKKQEYIFMSLLNVAFGNYLFSINKYIAVISFILCFFIYYYSFDENKDKFKAGIYILVTILIKLLLDDSGLSTITLFNIGIFVLLAVVLSRDIIIKHSDNYKRFEYISLALLYSIAFFSYSDEVDGMLFVLLLLGLTIIGYTYKWGPIFLMSLVFILINTFLLTRMFWFSIPWWVYILLIGIILISFAIRNEISENNKKENKLKDIAKKMNL